jgi:hypothetical protein
MDEDEIPGSTDLDELNQPWAVVPPPHPINDEEGTNA